MMEKFVNFIYISFIISLKLVVYLRLNTSITNVVNKIVDLSFVSTLYWRNSNNGKYTAKTMPANDDTLFRYLQTSVYITRLQY